MTYSAIRSANQAFGLMESTLLQRDNNAISSCPFSIDRRGAYRVQVGNMAPLHLSC